MFWRHWIDGIACPLLPSPRPLKEGLHLSPLLRSWVLCGTRDFVTHKPLLPSPCQTATVLEPQLTSTSSQDSSRVSTAASGLQLAWQHRLDFNLQRPSASTVLALQVSSISGEGPDADAGCLVLTSALRFCLCFGHYSLVPFFYAMQDTEPRALSMPRKCL